MWFSALLACIVDVITVHVVHKRNRKRVSPPWPPGPAGHPILGNLLYVIGRLRNNPHSALASLAQTYGPILSLRLGLTRTIVVVSSAAAAHEALAKNDAALASRLVPDTVRAMSYGATSMFFLPSSNPLWKQDRTIMGVRFSSGRGLDTIRPILECHAGHLTEHLRACSGTGTPVLIREAVNRTVLNVISNILFSEDVVDLRMPADQPFRGLIVPVLEEWSKSNVSDAFPFLAPIDHLLGSRRRISIHLAKLFKFFDQEIIQRRLARTSTGGKNTNDVLDILLTRHAMSKLTRQEIVTFLTDMFIAASDTSTVTVQWAMAQLLSHPEKMDKDVVIRCEEAHTQKIWSLQHYRCSGPSSPYSSSSSCFSTGKRLPPGPWQPPLFGSLHHVLLSRNGNLPHRALRGLSRRHGPLILLRFGTVPTLVVSSAEAAREVLKTHDCAFSSRHLTPTLHIFSCGGQDILFSPYGDLWCQLRRICLLELMSARRVLSFRHIREDEVTNMIHYITYKSAQAVA
ncbi:hypothetical protein ZWY2020_027061 [Hordeum vulgare]|nr:hypothetical protein ZWY2020_027061 [Hordeum vulgare]